MVQNIVNSINTWQDWYKFTDKVKASETYKHSWFVYAQTFNESEVKNGVCPDEVILAKGLTEAEAERIYKANKYAVENCGKDYADISFENLYDPCGNHPWVYQRATGENVDRAIELFEINNAVDKKFKALGLYD